MHAGGFRSKRHGWDVQLTLKLERQFQRSTGPDLAIRPERTCTTKATCS
jgi:hypothetical protein